MWHLFTSECEQRAQRSGSAADSGKTCWNNQIDGWQKAPRIPTPKAVGCNRLRPCLTVYKLLLKEALGYRRSLQPP